MKKLLILILLLPIVFAKKTEIYSAYTSHPYFVCPNDAERCELYEEVDSMSRNITPPRLVMTCAPGVCKYANDVGSSFGFRVLPGDIVFGASLFRAYKITNEPEEQITTQTTVFTTTETTQFSTTTISSCNKRSFSLCVSSSDCKWIGDMVIGRCVNKDYTTQTTLTTVSITTTTQQQPIQSCLIKGQFCQSNSECCSNICERRCLSRSILGFCIFSTFVSVCQ
ncbi:MAG: hypothetical protein QXE34_00880 [Candidatus Aenigmatarchaeota archaeon]